MQRESNATHGPRYAARRSLSEQRRHERVRVGLGATLFTPECGTTVDCLVTDISAGGASVRCRQLPPSYAAVVLYIDGFGRYEAVVVRRSNRLLALQFVCGEAKRSRLLAKLNRYVHEGMPDSTDARAHERVPYVKVLHFTRPNGQEVACDVIDISLKGISLQTKGKPPIDELIRVGRTLGRVVRHHDRGIGVEFVSPDDVPMLP